MDRAHDVVAAHWQRSGIGVGMVPRAAWEALSLGIREAYAVDFPAAPSGLPSPTMDFTKAYEALGEIAAGWTGQDRFVVIWDTLRAADSALRSSEEAPAAPTPELVERIMTLARMTSGAMEGDGWWYESPEELLAALTSSPSPLPSQDKEGV